MNRHGLRYTCMALILGVTMTVTACDAKETEDESTSYEGNNIARDGFNAIAGSANKRIDDIKKDRNPMPDKSENDAVPVPGMPEMPEMPEMPGMSGWNNNSPAHEPEYSYDGVTITIDGNAINMTDFAPTVTAIMDVQRVGDWLIIEGHVNPNMSIFEFYNVNKKPSPEFDYEIAGTNLIWQGEDLSTAVYAYYNEIYDFWGNQIGFVEDGELYSLSFKDSTTIAADCWKVDGKGNETEFTLEFEYEPCDRAVLLYYEFLLGGISQWYDLMAEAPEDALLLVIVNPPEVVRQKMIVNFDYEENAQDTLAVIALREFQQIHIEPIEYEDNSLNMMNARGMASMGMSEAILYHINVPEGTPSQKLYVKAAKVGEATWNICQLSGKTPQMSKFIIAGE